jgi:hypothetical protein
MFMADNEELYRAVGRVEGKIDEIISRLDRRDLLCKEHSDSINQLETFRDQTIGKATIFGAIAGFIGAAVLTIMGWFISHK